MIIPKFRILRLAFSRKLSRKSASKCRIWPKIIALFLFSGYLKTSSLSLLHGGKFSELFLNSRFCGRLGMLNLAINNKFSGLFLNSGL